MFLLLKSSGFEESIYNNYNRKDMQLLPSFKLRTVNVYYKAASLINNEFEFLQTILIKKVQFGF